MKDDIVEEVRRVREQLIKRYGGIDGYFRHCQALDRAWAARSTSRRTKARSRADRPAVKAR